MSEPAATPAWRASTGPLVDDHDAVLLDLDGVVYVGEHAVPGAVDAVSAVRERGLRVAFVTNNAARTPQRVAEHLSTLGVAAEPDDVVTSSQAAASMLRAQLPAGSRVLAVGAEGLTAALEAVGLQPVATADDGPVAVVQGFSPETSWQTLLEACVAVRAGLPWVATNLDATLPTPRGPAPGNGAFVEVVRRTTGVEPQVAGKPYRPLVDEAVQRTGARRALVVGDRLDTDLAGARAADLPGLLVLTGVSGVADLLAAGPDRRPSYVAADLDGLLRAHAAPAPDGDGWREGATTARWVGGDDDERLEIKGPQASDDDALAALRVACAAWWQRSDDGDPGGGDRDLREQVRAAVRPWTSPRGWDR
ncbi:HAD hydrolase-like protein [Angustibacter peucedani]